VHVDARAMVAAVAADNFSEAFRLLRKSVPFPAIIANVCEAPCQPVCRRAEAGGAIAVRALEQACVALSAGLRDPISRLPRRAKKVLVVGGGLAGLTAAYDLARKGYAVTVSEASASLGGSLHNLLPADVLAPLAAVDFAVLGELGIEIRLNARVLRARVNGPAPVLDAMRSEYDAIFLATGAASCETFGLATDANGRIQVDPISFQTGQECIFAGGGLSHCLDEPQPVRSISEGRRAAVSIDRYLQRVSLTAARTNEGSYPTRLFTSLRGLAPVPLTPMAKAWEGYSQSEAVAEAQRCIQCQCLECVKVCEFLEHYGSYPKKYVREIYNNLSIVKGDRRSNRMINSCSLCGLCAEVCPDDLNMGTVCREARFEMVQHERMPASAHDFALREMEFNTGPAFSLARTPPGSLTCEYTFFPGCNLSGAKPEIVERVYNHLQTALPGGAGLLLGCCGAPADWAGRKDAYAASLARVAEQVHALGNPTLILACPTCMQVFRQDLPQVKTISLWQVLAEGSLPAQAVVSSGKTVAIHDPCSARYETAMQDQVRELVRRAGYTIAELELSREKTECCSFGGLMRFANPEMGAAVAQRRTAETTHPFVTYCAMCRDLYAAQGKPSLHVLDLFFGQADTQSAARPGVGYSQKRDNRARLKHKLLAQIWGESMPEAADYTSIQLILSDDIQKMLDARFILVEDIQKVLEYSEQTGNRLFNAENNHFVAYHKLANVTYWVEFTRQGEAYLIHRAYSHRMEIAGKGAA
jgi:NADPH-dependent glutamate synthase beta subunit-like oxidoreductase